MPATQRYSAEMVRNLPDDGNRYEVVDGVLLVTPAPSELHQAAVMGLLARIAPYLALLGTAETMTAPADIELDPFGMVQPDLFVQGIVPGRGRGWNTGAPMLLFVEILSPSTARADRIAKRQRYQRAQIPEYWIVDPDSRTVERWRPSDTRPEVLTDVLEWLPPGAREPLLISLPELFRRIYGE